MTERLDRIEQLLERTGERQARTTEDIDTLLGAVASNEASIQKLSGDVKLLVTKMDEGNERFNVLRLEAQNDREETRRLFNDAVTQMEIDRTESRERFDNMLREIQEDRRKADERYSAQMEVVQTLLIELTKSNGNINAVNSNVNSLRDRVDGLERAS